MGPECHRKEGCRHLKCPPQLQCATVYTLTSHVTNTLTIPLWLSPRLQPIRQQFNLYRDSQKTIIEMCRLCQYIVGTSGLETILSPMYILRSAIPGLRAVWRASLTCTSCEPCLQTRPMSGDPKLHESPQSPRMGLIATLLRPGRS